MPTNVNSKEAETVKSNDKKHIYIEETVDKAYIIFITCKHIKGVEWVTSYKIWLQVSGGSSKHKWRILKNIESVWVHESDEFDLLSFIWQ